MGNRARGVAIACGVIAGGCMSVHVNYTPNGAEQRIGAAPQVLSSASEVWRCEGGERLALTDGGQTLFVASLDLFLHNPVSDGAGSLFSYERPSDGTNSFAAGEQQGVRANFFMPADRSQNVEIVYATNYIKEYSGGSTLTPVGNWTMWSSYQRIVGELLPVRADSCWRERAGVDGGASAQAIYRGAALRTGGPPPGARHLVVQFCGVNNANSRFGDRADLDWKEVQTHAYASWAGAEDSALVPQDMWISADGKVSFVRPDGTGFELTTPVTYSNVAGWEYARAGVPVFVNPTPGRTGAYVFRLAAPSDDPVPPLSREYAIACAYVEAP